MKLLLDTHAFLWFVEGSAELSANARELIESPENEVWLSTVSAWEIAIKLRLGRLTLSEPIDTFIPARLTANAISLLPIELPHVNLIASLPLHHGDPFDRLMIAQSIVEDVPIVSRDGAFGRYPIRVLW